MANCSRTLPFYCRDFTRGVPTVNSPGQRVEEEEIDVEEIDEMEENGPTAAEQLTAQMASEQPTASSPSSSPTKQEPSEPNTEGASRKREGEATTEAAPPAKK